MGSVERMIAILTESYAGKWPFWLSPRQAMVIPVSSQFDDYAIQVKDKLWNDGFMAELDTDPSDTLNKKIRNAQLAQFNFILGEEIFSIYNINFILNTNLFNSYIFIFLVVGEKELNAGTVNVRTRDNVVHGEILVDDLLKKFRIFKERKDKNCEENF